jgi:hypothetical protein
MVVCKKAEHQQDPYAAPPFDYVAHHGCHFAVRPVGYTLLLLDVMLVM